MFLTSEKHFREVSPGLPRSSVDRLPRSWLASDLWEIVDVATSQKFFRHFSEVFPALLRSVGWTSEKPAWRLFPRKIVTKEGYHLESGLRLTVRYIELFCRRGIHLSQRHALCVLDQSSSKQHPYMSAWCLRLCFLPRGVDVPPKLLRSMGSTDPLLTPAPYSSNHEGYGSEGGRRSLC